MPSENKNHYQSIHVLGFLIDASTYIDQDGHITITEIAKLLDKHTRVPDPPWVPEPPSYQLRSTGALSEQTSRDSRPKRDEDSLG
jgi:hypothetical protein